MKKPVIGIVPTYPLKNEENDPYKDTATFVTMYEEMIKKCGGIPIGLLDKDPSIYSSICDGYLWPGGNKIWPEFYSIIEDALANQKPILGICLGAEAIATYFNLIEDQKNMPSSSLKEVYDTYKQDDPYLIKLEDSSLHSHYVTKDINTIEAAKHLIQLLEDSMLHQIYQKNCIDVVSLHETVIHRVSKDTSITAKSEDHVIEAIEYTKEGNHILGCMFHPEILQDEKPFLWLVSLAKEKDLK